MLRSPYWTESLSVPGVVPALLLELGQLGQPAQSLLSALEQALP
jgi:hypothetical protein